VPTLKLPLVPLDKPVPLSPPTVQPTLDIERQGAYDELTPYDESMDGATSLPSSSQLTLRLSMVLPDKHRCSMESCLASLDDLPMENSKSFLAEGSDSGAYATTSWLQGDDKVLGSFDVYGDPTFCLASSSLVKGPSPSHG